MIGDIPTEFDRIRESILIRRRNWRLKHGRQSLKSKKKQCYDNKQQSPKNT